MSETLVMQSANSANLCAEEQTGRSRYVIYLALLFVVLLSIFPRTTSLDADPPPYFIPLDSGYHIDEGYKTLAAKNLLVFGATQWNKEDSYSGWLKKSPATQWPYYLSFREMGLELASARTVSVAYFTGFLILAGLILSHRYRLSAVVLCAMLLGTDPALFHFSRSALFETAIIFFIYSSMLLVSLQKTTKHMSALFIIGSFTVVTAVSVKASAVLYCAPAIAAISLSMIMSNWKNSGRAFIYLAACAVCGLLLAYITVDVWIGRIKPETLVHAPDKFLLAPILEMSELAILLGYSCLLHLLLVKPELITQNLYRLSLSATMVGAPLLLAFFAYNPHRYYIPVIPACLLLAAEWLHLKPWQYNSDSSSTPATKIAVGLLFIPFLAIALSAFNSIVVANLPVAIGDDPGVSRVWLVKLLPIYLPIAGLICISLRSRLRPLILMLIPLVIGLHLTTGAYKQMQALSNPSYQSQEIRQALYPYLQDSKSVAGDWAPFFTAEAPVRSLYMSQRTNVPTPAHIDKIRPDYFLSSNSPFDPRSLELLRDNESIQVGPAIVLGDFLGRPIELYQLSY